MISVTHCDTTFPLRTVWFGFVARRVGIGSEFVNGHYASPFTFEPDTETDAIRASSCSSLLCRELREEARSRAVMAYAALLRGEAGEQPLTSPFRASLGVLRIVLWNYEFLRHSQTGRRCIDQDLADCAGVVTWSAHCTDRKDRPDEVR